MEGETGERPRSGWSDTWYAEHRPKQSGNIGRIAARDNSDVPGIPRMDQFQKRLACQTVPFRSVPATKDTLCPPNPKLLDMTTLISRSRGVFGV